MPAAGDRQRNDAALGVFNGRRRHGPAQCSARPCGCVCTSCRVRSCALLSVARLAHVETAFAMTVHKSQGSEFEHTALVLSAQAGSVLRRELVYTGITRARQRFTLMAERPGLLAAAIASSHPAAPADCCALLEGEFNS